MKPRTWAVLVALLLSSGIGAVYAYVRLQTLNHTTVTAPGPDLRLHRIADSAAPPLLGWRPIVLFGEVHDNAAQHALRLEGFKALLQAGARPALLMEQFDRERQPEIDRIRASVPRPSTEQIILAGSGESTSGGSRWNWAYYRPLIELALMHDLPIVAANVSRGDARRVIADGLAAHGFDAQVPPDVERAQAEAIERSHCDMIDGARAKRMAAAQIARDQAMARLIETHAARGVVLLAGNGHVRTDIGVPRWLTPATRERAEAIGLLEEGDLEAGAREAYDRVFTTPRQPRTDPCEGMRTAASTRT